MKDTKYNLAIVPSPSSVGYVAVDDDLNLLQPIHHKTAIGVRKFSEANTAEDRRINRASFRRNNRKKSRIKHLNAILGDEIFKVDPLMLDRLAESGISSRDSRKQFSTIVLNRKSAEAMFHREFPTIWHLEKYLMETDEKADIKLIYIALHALLKRRGHFYNPTPVSQFRPNKLDIKATFKELASLQLVEDAEFSIANSPEIEKILLDRKIFKKDKISQLQNLIFEVSEDADTNKRNRKIAKQFANAILGNVVHLDEVFNMDLNKEEKKDWGFKLSDPSVDEKLATISGGFTAEQTRTVEILQELFSSLTLLDILKGSNSLVDAKIKAYDKHKRNLNFYMEYAKTLPKEKEAALKHAYTLYIGNRHKNLVEYRKEFGVNAASDFSLDDFYKTVKKIIKDEPEREDKEHLLELIDTHEFLLKQRTTENAYIPYQVNAKIVNKILENQGKHYPVLVEPNPSKPDIKEAPYKISQLMQFTIPYYVGPLTTPDEQIKAGIPKRSRFAWMVRREEGPITPWNFYEKVDVVETANQFIKRSIAKDSILLSELVLPKSSLLYQKYVVLEELSNISINGKKLTVSMKQTLYNEVFKKHATVSVARVKKFFAERNLEVRSISGLADPKKFLSGLTTYNAWKKVFPEQIDNLYYREDIENMIEWCTVFEDRKILAKKLTEITWLDDKQRSFVINQRLVGWGRFSKKLLVGIKDKDGKSIITNLYSTRRNFKQIITQPVFNSQIEVIKAKVIANQSIEDILEAAYLSPINKKAVRQTLKVINEFKELYGHNPEKIFLTFQRSDKQNHDIIDSRVKALRKTFGKIKNDMLFNKQLLNELKEIAQKQKRRPTTKEFLYFSQLGRDALTGELIDFNNLRQYNVLHIIPRSKLIDDSQNNLILTNVKKSDGDLGRAYGSNSAAAFNGTVKDFWNSLVKLDLMSKAKLNNLTIDMSHITPYESKGYIARQLVETNQIVKLIATILQTKLKGTTIIEVRQDQISNVRYQFDFYRNKLLNDYYKGFDAYLAAVIGSYLYKVYPKARRYFVYGEYLRPIEKEGIKPNEKPTANGNFNFLWRLLYGKDNRIDVNHTTDFAFDRSRLIDQMTEVYNYHYQNVSIATETRSKNMFKATIYPRSDRDTAKKRTLIEKKKGYATSIYGGYTSEQSSYLMLVQVKDSKGNFSYQFYGMPTRFLVDLEKAKKEGKYQIVRNSLVYDIVNRGIKNPKDVTVLKDKIPFNQIVIEEGEPTYLTSTQYRWNVRQLILSEKAQKTLMDLVIDPDFNMHKAIKEDEDTNKRLDDVYNEILYQVKNFMPIYKINRNIEKLEKGKKLFTKLSFGKKVSTLRTLLVSLHADNTAPKMPYINISTLACVRSGQPISENAKFVFQSPTGMQVKTITVKQLLKNDKIDKKQCDY